MKLFTSSFLHRIILLFPLIKARRQKVLEMKYGYFSWFDCSEFSNFFFLPPIFWPKVQAVFVKPKIIRIRIIGKRSRRRRSKEILNWAWFTGRWCGCCPCCWPEMTTSVNLQNKASRFSVKIGFLLFYFFVSICISPKKCIKKRENEKKGFSEIFRELIFLLMGSNFPAIEWDLVFSYREIKGFSGLLFVFLRRFQIKLISSIKFYCIIIFND